MESYDSTDTRHDESERLFDGFYRFLRRSAGFPASPTDQPALSRTERVLFLEGLAHGRRRASLSL